MEAENVPEIIYATLCSTWPQYKTQPKVKRHRIETHYHFIGKCLKYLYLTDRRYQSKSCLLSPKGETPINFREALNPNNNKGGDICDQYLLPQLRSFYWQDVLPTIIHG
jgi:hypothetical protein